MFEFYLFLFYLIIYVYAYYLRIKFIFSFLNLLFIQNETMKCSSFFLFLENLKKLLDLNL